MRIPGRVWQALEIALLTAVVVWALDGALILGDRLILDETSHLGQIRLFLDGRLELLTAEGERFAASAMFPGFHALLAGLAWMSGVESAAAIRSLCFGLSLVSWLLMYSIARVVNGADGAVRRAFQAYFVPVLFPFHFLVYTDGLSVLVALAALLACLRRHWGVSGLLMLLALLVRQTNVVFSLFLIAYSYGELEERWSIASLGRHLRRCWLLILGIAAFAAFVLVNGRVGLDDPSSHPPAFSLGNVAFSLFCCGLLFLPMHVANLAELPTLVRNRLRLTACLVGLAVLVACTYSPSHHWNFMPGLLRNSLLGWLTGSVSGRTVFAVVVAATACSLSLTELVRPTGKLIYVYWLLVLVPVLLVEPRYYVLPFVLLVLFRGRASPSREFLLLFWFMLLAMFLHYGVVSLRFLP